MVMATAIDPTESTAAQESAAAAGGGRAARVSIWESLRGCGLLGVEIDPDELRRRMLLPEYVRAAIAAAIAAKDGAAGASAASAAAELNVEAAPEAPIVVFVNSLSGGRHGPQLALHLHELISKEQVFDTSVVKPNEFLQYGLTCLELLAAQGDACSEEIRNKLRIMVAGGDGTVGWVLGCLTDLSKRDKGPIPPVGIIPLGTGNDLSRSFGWGGSFPFGWRSAVKRYLYKATTAPIHGLDSWQVRLVMPEGELKEYPHAVKTVESVDAADFYQDPNRVGDLPERLSCYEGVFYNYFSIGMDAQVAYGFHHLRNEKPYLAAGPVANKMIYAGYGCTQGWFCASCSANPQLRGLANILHLFVKKESDSQWEQVPIHPSVRSIVALNLYNYGSGRHPWGDLKPEYLEKRGFVEARPDDGLIEVFGLKEGWHSSFVLANLIQAKHIAQGAAVKFELRGGQWNRAYLQMDGEPWEQPLSEDYSTFIEIKKVPYQSLMLNG